MKDIKNDVLIEAPAALVWDLLTNPSRTPEYMYTCAIETDLQEGSTILWRGINDQVVYVSGRVIAITPNHSMTYSVIDPNGKYEQTEENHLIVSYLLEEKDGQTKLSVVQSGYETVALGQERYDEAVAGAGWSGVLAKIKEMAEK